VCFSGDRYHGGELSRNLDVLIGVPKETLPGERRVALTPADLPGLAEAGLETMVEAGAGVAAGFSDAAYHDAGARLADRSTVFSSSALLLQVRALGANPDAGRRDLERLRPG
jgi:NAD(P) transhydrogenase subunit alpha